MIINLGDTIEDVRGRQGVVTNIGIATERTDIAAQNKAIVPAIICMGNRNSIPPLFLTLYLFTYQFCHLLA